MEPQGCKAGNLPPHWSGGQNVNKVETTVRGTHFPSGLQVMAMDTRSQLENKKLCLARLEAKILVWQTEQLIEQQQIQWQEHNALERGYPVKTVTCCFIFLMWKIDSNSQEAKAHAARMPPATSGS